MRTCRMLLIAGLVPAVLSATPQSAASGALAPVKPSQIVTLTNRSGNDCPFTGEAMDQQLLPDGSSQPFTVPAKQVLVVTEVSWGTALAPGDSALLGLSVQAPAATASVPFFTSVTPTDSTGTGGSNSLVANAIVGSGNTLCAEITGGGFTGVIVRGFLTKER